MINLVSDLGITGHLQIERVYADGRNEIVFDDHNTIVSGMSVGLSMLFSLSGSNTISDYQFDRFQVGVSGGAVNEVSSTYQLSGPLSSTGEYVGTAGNLITASAIQIKDGSDVADQVFAKIPFRQVTRLNDTSVRYTIILDKDSCNNIQRDGSDKPLNEIGLFMRNPRGSSPEASILSAYKVFSDQTKTEEFSLIFRWTINF